nr:hypothetical protein [Subtercola boreus]
MAGVDREGHHPHRGQWVQDAADDPVRADKTETADERCSHTDGGDVQRQLGGERLRSHRVFPHQLPGDPHDEAAAEHPELRANLRDVEPG